jgi:transposase-like protein
MTEDGEPWRRARLRQVKYANNIVERDHHRPKRLVRSGIGFASLRTAQGTPAGDEVMAMMRTGQVRKIGQCDMQAQATLSLTSVSISEWR